MEGPFEKLGNAVDGNVWGGEPEPGNEAKHTVSYCLRKSQEALEQAENARQPELVTKWLAIHTGWSTLAQFRSGR